jgi:hypothetical protein
LGVHGKKTETCSLDGKAFVTVADGGAEMKTTVRNLRIREDTPKYLRNLDLNSAYYDPKARSMRSNPLPNENPEDLAFAGDNFVRYSGDALTMQATQVLCWEMQARGESIDMISNPSQMELLRKQLTSHVQPRLAWEVTLLDLTRLGQAPRGA